MDFTRFKNTLLLQRKPLLLGGALFVTSALVLGLGAYPLWGSIETVQVNLRQEQQALEKIRQRAALISNITPEDTQKFTIVSDALPTQKEPLATVAQLQNIAGEAKVTLGKFDINPGLISTGSTQEVATTRRTRDKKGSSTQFLDLETEFLGSFSALRSLIVLIEHARPVLEVQTLTLDPEKRQVGTGSANIKYLAKIRLRSYYATFDPKVLVSGGAQVLNKEQQSTFALLTQMKSWVAPKPTGSPPSSTFTNTDIFGMGRSAASPSPLLTPTEPVEELPEPQPEE